MPKLPVGLLIKILEGISYRTRSCSCYSSKFQPEKFTATITIIWILKIQLLTLQYLSFLLPRLQNKNHRMLQRNYTLV